VLSLALLIVSIGIVDSLNPSTVVPALYFASGAAPARRTLAFALGVASVNLIGGVALLLGPGRLIRQRVPDVGDHTVQLLEVGFGACAVGAAVMAWLMRARLRRWSARTARAGGRGAFVSGAALAALELPTAVPYFAAIAAVEESRVGVVTAIAMLALFNLAFVAPLLLIALLSRVWGERMATRAEEVRTRFLTHLGGVIALLLLVLGLALIGVGAYGLVA
jgi:cytochrome c biogenesis protein CcdA